MMGLCEGACVCVRLVELESIGTIICLLLSHVIPTFVFIFKNHLNDFENRFHIFFNLILKIAFFLKFMCS